MNKAAKPLAASLSALALASCAISPPPLPDRSTNQIYWDGHVEPDVPAGTCAAQEDYLARTYGHPPLMAIGDSLYNGVQSMRINWWLSEWSAPTLVAVRLGLIDEFRADRTGGRRFYDPQYRDHGLPASTNQNYGFNLENVTVATILAMPQTEYAALNDLQNGPPPDNHRPMVDNLAFSGAASADLIDWTAADYKANADRLLPQLRTANLGSEFGTLSDTFFNVNAHFVLNPMHNNCIDKMSALDQVRVRKPRRLLVNIGANDGLWRIAFFGDSIDKEACPRPQTNVTLGGLPDCRGPTIAEAVGVYFASNMARIVRQLGAIPGIERVYINGMPLPSQTANLVPDATGSRWNADLFAGPFSRPGLTAAQMRDGDDLIAGANAKTRATVEAADAAAKPGYPRFAYVDLAQKLAQFDYKGCMVRTPGADCTSHRLKLAKARFGLPFDQYLDNKPLRFDGPSGAQTGPHMQDRITQGGLMSFDNMHLSSVGYEIMAQAVIGRMDRLETDMPPIFAPDHSDLCRAPGDPGYDTMKPGDCIGLMTTPGWAFADSTERNFVFDRLGGDRQTQDREFFSAIAGFAEGVLK